MAISGIGISLAGIEAGRARLAAVAHDIAGAGATQQPPEEVDLTSRPISAAGVGSQVGGNADSRTRTTAHGEGASRGGDDVGNAVEMLEARQQVTSNARALGVQLRVEESLIDLLA